MYLYFEVFADFYHKSSHRLKKHDQFIRLFRASTWVQFQRKERREWRNRELFTSNSTRASLLLFTNVTSVTCGLSRSKFTITVNVRWQIGRWTSDQIHFLFVPWGDKCEPVNQNQLHGIHRERQKTEQNPNTVQYP